MKALCKLMIMGTLALAATPAAATTFVGTYDVTVNSADPGLMLDWSPISAGLNFDLNSVGQSTSFPLFQLWTNETTVNWDDLAAKPINVAFTFTLPSNFSGGINGQTYGQTLFGILQNGAVHWNNGGDALLTFGNGGQLLAHLDDATFNGGLFGLNEGQGNGAAINATFTLNSQGVPEPATWAMMILGMGMVGAGLRLRRRLPLAAAA